MRPITTMVDVSVPDILFACKSSFLVLSQKYEWNSAQMKHYSTQIGMCSSHGQARASSTGAWCDSNVVTLGWHECLLNHAAPVLAAVHQSGLPLQSECPLLFCNCLTSISRLLTSLPEDLLQPAKTALSVLDSILPLSSHGHKTRQIWFWNI